MKKRLLTRFGWILFYLYIILLFYFLFLSERYGRDHPSDELRYNLVFFQEIKRFIQYRHLLGFENFVVNILGNVIAFAPFGFLLPILKESYRSFFVITFLSMFFSLSIELIQLTTRVGIFDVDDILLNTLGGVLGYIIFLVFNGIRKIIKQQSDIRG
ncbi:MAG TPA: VanZ family protein [Clostridiales bacterium]|nr:VanZ family protein [Clostridiales bacterium]